MLGLMHPVLFLSPEGRQVGGRAEAHLGPSSRGFARSRTRAQKGRRARKARRDPGPPDLTAAAPPPTPPRRALGLPGRAPAASLTGPRAPAGGARAAPREGGGGGEGARRCARSRPPGEGDVRRRHLVSLALPASSGACSPPPSRRGGGRAPSGSPPSPPRIPLRAAVRATPELAPLRVTPRRGDQSVGEKGAATPGDPAAAAAPEASPKWPPPSRPLPPLPPPPPPRLVIATAGAARPLAIHSNWRLEGRVSHTLRTPLKG
ncbi:serine/arginine repetitive matrix protein 1 isoform X2 [Peromyscus leucopus]|uniref:serine/arginine repetitive matrix protein 1 isoform X2 n=1 Tax=Peromyscus leucopus TaxID=10041 RepID=UPI001884B920|nr:serine/arginine repetitive matrix protein 1 isoform X2 [Peromyscus leucopus]